MKRIADIIDDIAVVDIDESTAVRGNNAVVPRGVIRRIITDNTVDYLQLGITQLKGIFLTITCNIDRGTFRRGVIREAAVTQLITYHVDTLGLISNDLIAYQHTATCHYRASARQIMSITVEKMEAIDDRIFGIYIRKHVSGVIRISCHSFLVRDIRRDDSGQSHRVTSLRIRACQSLRITAIQTHVRQRTDRCGTHVFT